MCEVCYGEVDKVAKYDWPVGSQYGQRKILGYNILLKTLRIFMSIVYYCYFQLLIGSRFIEFIRPVLYSVEVKKKWTDIGRERRMRRVLTVSQLNALDSILNQTIHPSERMVAQLSKSTGLTALEVKNQRRRLHRNQLKDRALREDDISSRFCYQLSCSGSGQDFKCNNGTYNIIGVRIDIKVANV
ncbi:hypothetical protein F5877DRAFT_73185 [Lentinula edodes]|nr:hypothetical protein F5877DRAFT_73185 [Lentinula edodes]